MKLDRGSTPQPPSFEGDDRFEIRSTLGRGTSSVVYRAFDRQRGAEVALKVLSVQGSAGMLAFKREFRSMADLAHPNLVKLYELHAAGNGLMFTMELVDGTDFLGYVRRPVGALPDWDAEAPRPPAPERDTVAEWSGPAPERVPLSLAGSLSYFPALQLEQIPTLRSALAQVVRGLMALHDSGHVHRDVKPSNVMVDDTGRAVLLDFGVAAESAGQAQAAGTPAYMSPEQAQGERPSPSADFYAVGVMLYEALTGQLPHDGDDPVRDKLARDAEPPSALVPDVPIDLDRLCVSLLARDPALRPEGSAILDLLCGDAERTLAPRNRTITPLLGRDAELARLEAAMQRATHGEGQTVLITGRSGMGKSALMRQFLARQRRNGAVVLTGRCYEQESVPYKALDAVMDAVCQHLAAMPADEREEVMPRHRWALGRLFPVLAQYGQPMAPPARTAQESGNRRATDSLPDVRTRQTVPVTGPRPVIGSEAPRRTSAPFRFTGGSALSSDLRLGSDPNLAARSTVLVGAPTGEPDLHEPVTIDPTRVRRQGVTALRQLLEALARHSPLIIAIDDLQWGDVDSAQVLSEVLSSPPPPLLLLGSYRREDQETSEFLRNFLAAQSAHETLELQALDPEASRLLARSLVVGGDVGADEIVAEAKGDPFLMIELARFVSSRRSAAKVLGRGITVEAVMRARIDQLDAPARRLLEAISVAAGPIARAVARRAAELGSLESTALVQLRTANLLRVKGTRGAEMIETYHDRIRTAITEQLDDAARRAWHLRLVEALRTEGPLDHERIAKHLEAGGRRHEAVPHYLQAAEASSATLAFDRAAALYHRALQAGSLPANDEVRVRNEYADVLMRQARFDEASAELIRARDRLGPSEDRARILHKLGEVELSRGDLEAAASALEDALADLGHPVPKGRGPLLWSNLREVLVQLRHTYLPRERDRIGRRPAREAERLAMRIYGRLTHAYYFSRGRMQVFWPHLRELNEAERHAPTPELGRAYAGHGMMLATLPWFRRGLSYVQRSLDLQRGLGDRFGEAQALHQQGVVLYGASRFDDAARACMVAAERLESMGESPGAHDALLYAALAMHRLGRCAEATRLARRVHEEALDTGDVFAAAIGILAWALASGGRVPSLMIRVQAEISEQIGHQFTHVVAVHANGIRLLGIGRVLEAAEVLDRTAALLRDASLMKTELLAALDVWRATAWRRVAEQADDPKARARALAHARRRLRRGLWATTRFRNGLPQALREAGRIAAVDGSPRRARAMFDASIRVARRTGQTQEVAMTELVRDAYLGPHGPSPEIPRNSGLEVGLRLEGDPRSP